MFNEEDFKLSQKIGEYLGFFVALLIFASIVFLIFIRKTFSIGYSDFIGVITLFYLIYVVIGILKVRKGKEIVNV